MLKIPLYFCHFLTPILAVNKYYFDFRLGVEEVLIVCFCVYFQYL